MKQNTGKLIVIDGIDGAGKATQVALLVKRLRKAGVKAVGLDFPQYETLFGKLVARYLNNEFGKLNPYVASVLYAANRLEFKDKINSWLRDDYIVVLNRYVSSNQIHQAANIDSKKQRREFVRWISKMEYGVMELPEPDHIFFLNMPAEISYRLIEKKSKKARKYIEGSKRDMLEADLDHQKRALKQSFEVLKNYGLRCTVIESAKGAELLSKIDVNDKIWQALSKLIKFSR